MDGHLPHYFTGPRVGWAPVCGDRQGTLGRGDVRPVRLRLQDVQEQPARRTEIAEGHNPPNFIKNAKRLPITR